VQATDRGRGASFRRGKTQLASNAPFSRCAVSDISRLKVIFLPRLTNNANRERAGCSSAGANLGSLRPRRLQRFQDATKEL
jgi:hypothetical protein